MLYTLIRQELLAHVISVRFLAAAITILLVVANTVVLLDAYERRVASYRQQETVNHQEVEASPTYSQLNLVVERPPNPLSLFSAGLDTQLGGSTEIYHSHVPLLLDASVRSLGNPFLNLFSQIDLVFIFQVVLSLLALLFAYDAIAGDWEAGTLRLVISHPVRRGSILFAKYIAAMACLLLPVLISLFMVLILLSLASSVQLTTDHFLRIGGIILTTGVYLSVFYSLGLLISTITRRTATSLMLCMFMWVFSVMVYPNWSRFAIDPVGDMRNEKLSTERQEAQIWEEAKREERRFLTNSLLMGSPPMFNLNFSMWSSISAGRRYQINCKVDESSAGLIPHVQDFHKFISLLQIHSAEKAALARDQMLMRTYIRQARWDERLMKISPAGLYRFAASAWAGTDLDGMLDFILAVQQYRQTLLDYFHDEGAFASQRWFASDQGNVDWSNLPRFTFQQTDVWVNVQRAIVDVLLLFLMSLVLFVFTFLIFIKTEV